MDTVSLAEGLPALYRAVLDEVAELERRGARREGERARTAAIRIYSRAWDERGRRDMEGVLRRARRASAGMPPERVPVAQGRALPTP